MGDLAVRGSGMRGPKYKGPMSEGPSSEGPRSTSKGRGEVVVTAGVVTIGLTIDASHMSTNRCSKTSF